MYRVNPMTYLVSSFLSTSLGDAPMRCADNEVLSFSAPAGKACADYMKNYISANSGYLLSSGSQMNDDCKFCAMGNSNDFLSSLGISFSNRWRDFGILCVYIVVNTVGAIVFYKLFRVPRSKTVKN
jgi:ABC-type multidrug transport system permease subunit